MTKSEVESIVSGAVEQTEASPVELLPLKRKQMAAWLYKKFQISIKELVVNINDGLPYLKVEYINNKGKVAETSVSMSKYQDRLTKELETMTEKLMKGKV